jgi:hypothetical protein
MVGTAGNDAGKGGDDQICGGKGTTNPKAEPGTASSARVATTPWQAAAGMTR